MKLNSSMNDVDRRAQVRQRLQLIQILDAAETAGITPLPLPQLHAFAYLSNVLSPIWELRPIEGKILKRKGGPYYPILQHNLDGLVGTGVAVIKDLQYERDHTGRWRLVGSYFLNYEMADPILDAAFQFHEECSLQGLFCELAYAFAALGITELDQAIMEDATYADSRSIEGQVVDFAEWKDANYTANTANYFDNFMPTGLEASPGAKIQLYVRYLESKSHA